MKNPEPTHLERDQPNNHRGVRTPACWSLAFTRVVATACLFSLLVGAIASARAQPCADPAWRSEGYPPAGPGAMTFDSLRHRMVYLALDDWGPAQTWEWDGATWTQHADTGPAGRNCQGFVFFLALGKSVLLSSGIDGTVSETWTWDGTQWQLLNIPCPPPRQGASMAVDPSRQRAVMYGGVPIDRTNYTETWEFDGAAWSRASTIGPGRQDGPGMSFDPIRNRVLLVGDSDTDIPATWEWDGIAWSQIQVPTPSGLRFLAAATDTSRQRILLTLANNVSVPRDTWEWDGAAWTHVSTPSPGQLNSPLGFDPDRNEFITLDNGESSVASTAAVWRFRDGRWSHDTSTSNPTSFIAGTYDEARDRVVAVSPLFETWEYDGSVWRLAAPAFASGLQSPRMVYDAARQECVLIALRDAFETWTWNGVAWRLASVTGPPLRWGAAVTYDSAHQVVLLFGGYGASIYQDTWQWNGTLWSQVASTGPARRYFAAMAFDPIRQKVILHGGSGSSGIISNANRDHWEWNGTSWSNRTIPCPPNRERASMAFDPVRGVLVLFGGFGGNNINNQTFLSDTWEWNGTAWVRQTSSEPGARASHTLAFDTARARMLSIGGNLGDRGSVLWARVGIAWSRVPDALPIFRSGAAIAYHEAAARAVMVGGSGDRVFAETWVHDGTRWTRDQGTGPSPRIGAAITYDSARQRVVLFGGSTSGVPPHLADTWEWDGVAWTSRPGVGPSPRVFATLAFDPMRRRSVLFGGTTDSNTDSSEVWEWDGQQWTMGSPGDPAGPVARRFPRMTYDPQSAAMLMTGGTPTDPFAATWGWNGTSWRLLSNTGLNLAFTNPVYVPDRGLVIAFQPSAYPLLAWAWNGIEWMYLPSDGPVRLVQTAFYDARRGLVTLVEGGATLNEFAYWGNFGAPRVWSAPPQLSLSSCDPLDLAAEATGLPPLAYQWTRNGMPIDAETRSTLHRDRASGVDAGEYRCQVTSPCGVALSAPTLVGVCVPDVDDGTGTGHCDGGVTIDDLLYYLTIFETGLLSTDVDDGSGTGTLDGGVTIDDLLYYLQRFEAGC